jgi:hypothetical protein
MRGQVERQVDFSAARTCWRKSCTPIQAAATHAAPVASWVIMAPELPASKAAEAEPKALMHTQAPFGDRAWRRLGATVSWLLLLVAGLVRAEPAGPVISAEEFMTIRVVDCLVEMRNAGARGAGGNVEARFLLGRRARPRQKVAGGVIMVGCAVVVSRCNSNSNTRFSPASTLFPAKSKAQTSKIRFLDFRMFFFSFFSWCPLSTLVQSLSRHKPAVLNLHGRERLVGAARHRHVLELAHHRLALEDAPKDDVLAVQPRGFSGGDEELHGCCRGGQGVR